MRVYLLSVILIKFESAPTQRSTKKKVTRRLDIDYYDKAISGSGSVKDSVDFVASYAGRIDEWPYKEIISP